MAQGYQNVVCVPSKAILPSSKYNRYKAIGVNTLQTGNKLVEGTSSPLTAGPFSAIRQNNDAIARIRHLPWVPSLR